MMEVKCVVFLVVLTFLWTPSRGDPEVSCVLMERCILPCSFQVGPDVVIHWIYVITGFHVHSYYNNQDQFGHQHQLYRNRTSLFKDQISRGNASLQLTGVKVQDEGRYKCYISTINRNKESFINLKVEAPVHKVNIQQIENNITCSSEGIYSQPQLTWSTTPPSNISLHNTTTVQQNEQQLYSISSSLILSHSHTDLVYSCTVKTRRNRWTATLRHQTVQTSSETTTTIPCTTSNSSLSGFRLIWRFNQRQMIMNRSSTDGSSTVSEEWRQQVKDVSESGDITLQDLSSHQEGVYTCEVSDADETLLTDTVLKIEEGGSVNVAAIAAGVVVPILVLAVLGLVGFNMYKKKKGVEENDKKNNRKNGRKNRKKFFRRKNKASTEETTELKETSKAGQ